MFKLKNAINLRLFLCVFYFLLINIVELDIDYSLLDVSSIDACLALAGSWEGIKKYNYQ